MAKGPRSLKNGKVKSKSKAAVHEPQQEVDETEDDEEDEFGGTTFEDFNDDETEQEEVEEDETEKEVEEDETEEDEEEIEEDENISEGSIDGVVRKPQKSVKGKRGRRGKTEKKLVLPVDRLVQGAMRKAGVDKLPDLNVLFKHRSGKKVKLSDVAVFVDEEPADDVLKELSVRLPMHNEVHLSAGIDKNRIRRVGADILKCGWIASDIEVAKLEGSDVLHCVSGRHRLAFIAAAYGGDVTVVVQVAEMDLSDARKATVYTNQARPTGIREAAELAVIETSGGVDCELDALYGGMVRTKRSAVKFAVYLATNVTPKGGMIKFPVREKGKSKGNSVTTWPSLKNFWQNATFWSAEVTCKDFVKQYVDATKFLNALVDALLKTEGFEPSQHMSTMAMRAIGSFYKAMLDAGSHEPIDIVEIIADGLVAITKLGRMKNTEAFAKLRSNVKRRIKKAEKQRAKEEVDDEDE